MLSGGFAMSRREDARKPNFMLPVQAIGILLMSMFVCILKESHPFYGTWPAPDAPPMDAFMWLVKTVLIPSVIITSLFVYFLFKRSLSKRRS